MTHLDRTTLERFFDSNLDHEEVEQVLAHLSSCVQCEAAADELWFAMEPRFPGAVLSAEQPSPVSRRRQERIRQSALKKLRFGQLLAEWTRFFFLGLARLLQVGLAPLQDVRDDSSESGNRGRTDDR